MRLLLEAHVSAARVGQRLTAAGHEVRALDQEPALEGLDDDDVLALAAAEERILVTHNVRDFPAILRDWSAAGREHSGVILVYGVDHREFDVLVVGIERCFELYPEPAASDHQTHHLADEPIRTARAAQDPYELLVRPTPTTAGLISIDRLEPFHQWPGSSWCPFDSFPSGVRGSAYGAWQACGVSSASVLFE